MLKIYGMPLSTPVNRVRFTANHLGLEYEFVPVKLLEGEQQSEWFLALNPAGKVPVIDDDGFTLFESLAICRYLCRKHDAAIYPATVEAAAITDQWIDFASSHIGGAMAKVMFNRLFAPIIGIEVDERSLTEGGEWLDKYLPIIDSQLSKHAFLTGDDLSLADIVLLANLDPAEVVDIDLSAYGSLSAWRDGLKKESFYTRCHKDFGEIVEALMGADSGP